MRPSKKALQRCPHVKEWLSHAGGCVPAKCWVHDGAAPTRRFCDREAVQHSERRWKYGRCKSPADCYPSRQDTAFPPAVRCRQQPVFCRSSASSLTARHHWAVVKLLLHNIGVQYRQPNVNAGQRSFRFLPLEQAAPVLHSKHLPVSQTAQSNGVPIHWYHGAAPNKKVKAPKHCGEESYLSPP